MTRRVAFGGTVTAGLIGVAALLLGTFGDAGTESVKQADAAAQQQGETVPMPDAAGEPVRLTGGATEDDHPALAKGPDGAIWAAYFSYSSGGDVDMEAVRDREFDSLTPEGHGDQVWLRKFDGQRWQPAISVTGKGLNVWRPTVAVDGEGQVVVAWAQKVDGDWEIVSRTYTPSDDQWSETENVSENEGSDFHVVSTTDADGQVWLAWQSWRDGWFALSAVTLTEGQRGIKTFGTSEVNNWSPSITADSQGTVYVAADYYGKDGYNLNIHKLSQEGRSASIKLLETIKSPKTLMRPNIVCDDRDRLWIAYEEGNEQWGKDFQGGRPQRVGIENLGYGLYIDRTLKVKCLENGTLKEPKADLQKALDEEAPRARSLPRLALDESGGLWLLFRHHRTQRGRGESWISYATRYDGRSWSTPQEVPESRYIIDNRTGLVPFEQGILAVYSTDDRNNTRNRKQNDVVAVVLQEDQEPRSPQLQDADVAAERDVAPVHPDEDEAVARMRDYEIEHNGKTLQLLRGEFHRHTEYTSHRDQDGLLEDAWRYALDAGALDWMGNGDHDNGFGHEFLWWQIQKYCDLMDNPPGFTAVMSYERSVVYPSGHRNVILPKRGIRPLPRLGRRRGDGRDLRFGTPEEGAPDVHLLYDYLQHFGGICASHTSATRMGTDWRDNHPGVEPIVEIYQAHRHNYEHKGAPRAPTEETQIGQYRPKGFIWNALDKGYKLGFQSSSDHVGTHMSYAVVLAEDSSPQALIDAFKKRHSYGATDNIILDVRSGEHLMGDEFETDEPPKLQIKAVGTAPIAKVHVIRDNEYVYTTEPMTKRVELSYTDGDARPGQTHYYYVRIEQNDENRNLAWASPMWITYTE